MHDLAVLRNLALIVGFAIPVAALAHRLRIPTLVGFLLVGVAIGPHGAALVPDPDAVAALAEIGVVLLLFEIGLELSLSQVLGWGMSVLVAGALQVSGVMALAAVAGPVFGLPVGQSLFYGALAALSSTAIVSRTLADRGDLDAPHGRESMAILLFQDLAIVPLMLVVPLFGADPAGPDGAGGIGRLWLRLGLGLAAMAALVAGGRLVVRWTLDRIVETRDRDLFTLCVGFFAMGTALAASTAGFSLAVGAFLAGLVISESEYGLQALDDVMPFRALFSGVFFTSIGMLLDLTVVGAQLPLLLGGTVLVLAVKGAVVAGAVMVRGRRPDTALATGLSLAQIGEFSFVLAAAGLPLGLFGAGHYEVFLAVAALSMLAAPFLVTVSRSWAVRLGPRARGGPDAGEPAPAAADHAIVVGYGLAGRYLARMLQAAGIECVIVDQNAELVDAARRDGFTALYGDGAGHPVLERAGGAGARLVVFAISSPFDERRGVAMARRAAPGAAVVVRTRYVGSIDELMRLGATEVVVEEFEASLELFARALERYEIPAARIAHELDAVRSEHYGLLRGRAQPNLHLDTLKHLGIHNALELVEVEAGAAAVGKSATALDLRRETGAVQIAVIRDGRPHYQREADFAYRAGDTAVLVGARGALDRAAALFRG